jgi:hypothetical protein
VEDRIYDTLAVTPGAATSRVFMSYRLPFEGTAARVEQAFLYPISQLNLLVADIADLEVDVAALEFVGNEAIQGFSYRLWGGQELAPQTIEVALTGLIPVGGVDPRAQASAADAAAMPEPATPPLQPVVPLALGGVLVVLLIGLVAWPLRNARGIDRATALQREQERLIERIAELDDRHAQEQIDGETWARERARLKSSLLDVAGQLAMQRSKP